MVAAERLTTSAWANVRRTAPALALLSAALLAWAPSLRNGFVWDDDSIIVDNPDTRDITALPRVILSPDEFPPYYRPLTRASFLLDHQLFGMDPRGFHAVNVVLHLGAVLALWALGLRLFSKRTPAFVAAFLLAIHPINAEAVNLIAGRNNALATLFALLAVVLIIDADRRGSRSLAVASGAAFFLGLLSKEPAVMALPVMAAWLLLPGAFGRERRGSTLYLAPHAVALAGYLLLRWVALGGLIGSAAPSGGAGRGLGARLLLNAYTIPRYFGLVFCPRHLTIFHPIPTFSAGVLLLSWGAIAAAAAYFAARATPASTFGLLWFCLNLLPIANIVSIPTTSLIAERYFYAPGIGLWILAGDACQRLARRDWRRWAALPAAAAAALLLVTARERSREWHDDFSLATSAVRAEPSSAEAHFNLGVVSKDQGDLERARREWESALRLDPSHARALVQRGTSSAVLGDYRAAEEDLRRAIAIDGDIPIAHFNLARVCELTSRPSEALAEYSTFLRTSRSPRESPFVARAQQRVVALAATR